MKRERCQVFVFPHNSSPRSGIPLQNEVTSDETAWPQTKQNDLGWSEVTSDKGSSQSEGQLAENFHSEYF